MARSKRTGKSYKEQYSRYKTEARWLKNKKRKLAKHIKLQPRDVQAIEALKNMKGNIRKTPINSQWTTKTKYEHQLVQPTKSQVSIQRTKKLKTSIKYRARLNE